MRPLKLQLPNGNACFPTITAPAFPPYFGRTPGQNEGYDPSKAYGQSKLANVLMANALARRMEGKGVYVGQSAAVLRKP
jgi:hypothetical protein